MVDPIVVPDDRRPPRPASSARLHAMARQLAQANADDDPTWRYDLDRAATRLDRENRERLKKVRVETGQGTGSDST